MTKAERQAESIARENVDLRIRLARAESERDLANASATRLLTVLDNAHWLAANGSTMAWLLWGVLVSYGRTPQSRSSS